MFHLFLRFIAHALILFVHPGHFTDGGVPKYWGFYVSVQTKGLVLKMDECKIWVESSKPEVFLVNERSKGAEVC